LKDFRALPILTTVDAGEPDKPTPGQNAPVSLRYFNVDEQAAARRFFSPFPGIQALLI
jgi:hypothetical protein